jgi:hypothetical protein
LKFVVSEFMGKASLGTLRGDGRTNPINHLAT